MAFDWSGYRINSKNNRLKKAVWAEVAEVWNECAKVKLAEYELKFPDSGNFTQESDVRREYQDPDPDLKDKFEESGLFFKDHCTGEFNELEDWCSSLETTFGIKLFLYDNDTFGATVNKIIDAKRELSGIEK